MRFAIADPPYPGQAHRYPEQTEVDHAELVARLVRDYPDGWALCTASTTLASVLALCPPDVRIGAWVKPFASFKPGVNPAYAWEPVIWRGGRKRERSQPTARDWVSANITLRRGLVGAKPEAFCCWLFELLNARPGDLIDDLYPGTKAVTTAWGKYCRQLWPVDVEASA